MFQAIKGKALLKENQPMVWQCNNDTPGFWTGDWAESCCSRYFTLTAVGTQSHDIYKLDGVNKQTNKNVVSSFIFWQ